MTKQLQQTKIQGSSRFGRVFGLLVLVTVVGALAYNKQSAVDWWRLRGYDPPSAVAQYATQDTMTSYARKVLYVNAPQLQAKAAFTKNCSVTEQAAILGCYHGNQAGIFVLSVADPRLDGIEQVTTAHEMLHAAYDRLSSRQKKSVDAMLLDYYNNGLHDQTILDQMAAYKKSEPDAVVNEMHSVFGTEVDTLPAPLEQYYKKYFADRSKVAHLYDTYQAEFTSRQAAIKADDAQLATLKAQITANEADLQTKDDGLKTLRAQLDEYKASRNFAAYNAGVPGYNAAVAAYNTEVNTVRGLIDQYNQLVASRNAIAAETQQLSNEITSQVSPIAR